MLDITNKTCQIWNRKTPWPPIYKSSEPERCAKNSLVSSITFHITCAQHSGVNFPLFSLTASVSIISPSLKTWRYSGHRSTNNAQSSAAKLQSISIRAYIFPGGFLGLYLFIYIAYVFVIVNCGSFSASSLLIYYSNAWAPRGRTMSGVVPLSALSNTATDTPGVNLSFIIS